MPNHVANYVIITGAENILRQFWKKATTNAKDPINTDFDYDNLYPLPKNEEENWYKWCIEHWGNKWGCYEVENISNTNCFESGSIELRYKTAWSSSRPFWTKITKDYKIKVLNYFHDEGSCFCGEEKYEDGNVQESKIFHLYDVHKKQFVEYAKLCGRTNWYDHEEETDTNSPKVEPLIN